MKLSFVVPVFNEKENLEECYDRIKKVAESLASEFEIIFVDDGSQDGSLDVLKSLNQRDSRSKFVSLSRNFGHQVALTAGLDVSDGDATVTLDGDLQHPPEVVKDLVKRWKEGIEIVYTVRDTTKVPHTSKGLVSRWFYSMFSKLSDVSLPPNAADFRLMDKRVVEAFRLLRERHRFLRGLVGWVGYSSVGVLYVPDARKRGETKYSTSRMTTLGLDGLLAFSAMPLQIVVIVGLLFCLLGFIYALYIVVIKLFTSQAVPGWASIAFVVSSFGGVQLIVLGLMGLYISRIYDEVKQRPLYLVREKTQ